MDGVEAILVDIRKAFSGSGVSPACPDDRVCAGGDGAIVFVWKLAYGLEFDKSWLEASFARFAWS